MFSIFGKKKDNLEAQRDEARGWKRKLNCEIRAIERQLREVEDEQKKTVTELKEAIARKDAFSQKILAAELARSREACQKLIQAKSVLSSLQGCVDSSISTMRIVNNMKQTSDVIQGINDNINISQVSSSIRDFEKEMHRVGLAHEAIKETQEEFDENSISQVLYEISHGPFERNSLSEACPNKLSTSMKNKFLVLLADLVLCLIPRCETHSLLQLSNAENVVPCLECKEIMNSYTKECAESERNKTGGTKFLEYCQKVAENSPPSDYDMIRIGICKSMYHNASIASGIVGGTTGLLKNNAIDGCQAVENHCIEQGGPPECFQNTCELAFHCVECPAAKVGDKKISCSGVVSCEIPPEEHSARVPNGICPCVGGSACENVEGSGLEYGRPSEESGEPSEESAEG